MNIHSRGRLPVSLIRIAIIPAASKAAAARRLAAHSGITTKYNEPKNYRVNRPNSTNLPHVEFIMTNLVGHQHGRWR